MFKRLYFFFFRNNYPSIFDKTYIKLFNIMNKRITPNSLTTTNTIKSLYSAPTIQVTYVDLESCIAAASVATDSESLQHEWEDNQSISKDYNW